MTTNAACDGFAEPGDQLLLELEFTPVGGVLQRYPLKRTLQDMVLEFHETFGCAIDDRSLEWFHSREAILAEERKELDDELHYLIFGYGDLNAVAKEIADEIYVLFGTAVALGIDADKAVRLVHASNMSKLGADGKPIYRGDGKVLKGPNYVEPDMTSCVKEIR